MTYLQQQGVREIIVNMSSQNISIIDYNHHLTNTVIKEVQS